MALVINTNIASITAQNHASASRREMETSMERLSSGKRINSAADDAAGLSIATRLESQVRGMAKGVQNANDAMSLIQTAAGAQNEISDMLQRVRELSIQASNSTNNAVDRESLNAEVAQLIEEIDQIAATTKFNDQNILNGGFNANIQTGWAPGQEFGFSIDSMRVSDLGLVTSGVASSVSLNSYTTARTALAPSHAAIEEGDIVINGQALGAVAATDEITDVVSNINTNIEGVTASAFNEVVMLDVGTGVATANQILIGVQNVGSTSASTDVQFQSYMIDEDSTSLSELASLITTKTEGNVTATVNADGKLVLSNSTGASIHIKDLTAGAKATGLGSAANLDATIAAASDAYTPTSEGSTSDSRVFHGFIKLETTDGSAIRIEKGVGASTGGIGTQTELSLLGMQQVNVNDDTSSTYSLQGDALTTAETTTAWDMGDVMINGVDVYNSYIDTDTFAGKLNAINSVSAETGVTAKAQFEYFIDATSFGDFTGTVTLTDDDGSTTASVTLTSASVAALVTELNTDLDTIGGKVTAEAIGNTIRLYGDDQTYIGFTFDATASDNATVVAAFTGLSGNTSAQQINSAIQLETESTSAIQIDLGEDIASDYGLYEANVGAADFDNNAPQVSTGTSVGSIDISTIAGATSAISSIDAALQQVSASASAVGAVENRLNHVISNLQEMIVNTEASKSRIVDADFAVESSNLAKQQVLQQAATAMLAQANSSPQLVLSLLGG